jgi:hypothetical protein
MHISGGAQRRRVACTTRCRHPTQKHEDDIQGLLKLSRGIDCLNTQIGKYVIWLILASTAVSAINAIVRKAFNISSNAYLEVQWYLFAWSFLVAAGFTLLNREHVRIDVLNIQRTLLRRLVDVTGRQVLRDHAKLGHRLSQYSAAHAHLQSLEVGHGLDLLAVPPAHLGGGVAGAGGLEVVLGEEIVERLAAVAIVLPRSVLTCGQAERHGAANGEDRVLAGEVVSGGLRHLDVVTLKRIDHAEGGHQFTGGMQGDLELAS